jgi:putative MATE family efflux protein
MSDGRVTVRELVVLALPAVGSAVLNNTYRIVDQFSVQWLGTSAQAAIGSTTFVLISFQAVFWLTSAGAGPLVARATGARDPELLRKTVGSALTATVLSTIAVGLVAVFGADTLASLLGLSGETHDNAATYLRWLGLGVAGIAFGPLMDAIFIARGQTLLPMILLVGSNVLNAILNGVFIYGLGLGIKGSALATCVSRGLTMVVGFRVLWKEIGWTTGDMGLGDTALRLVRIGLPITINTLAYAWVYWALLAFAISPLGPTVNAALGIGFSALEGFTWPLFNGVSLAVASIVGRRLGAGQPDEALRAVRLAFPISTALGVGVSLVFWFGAVPLCQVFTADPLVLDEAVVYARALAMSQLFVAWEALFEGTLAGAGATGAVLLWSAPMNALRVPLGWWLAGPLGYGAAGVWWAINVTTYAKALGKGWSTWRGKWRRTVV